MKHALKRTLMALFAAIALTFATGTTAHASQCKGLTKSVCQDKHECSFVKAHTRSDGTKVKAFCRAKPGQGISKSSAKKEQAKTKKTTRKKADDKSKKTAKKEPTSKKSTTKKKSDEKAKKTASKKSDDDTKATKKKTTKKSTEKKSTKKKPAKKKTKKTKEKKKSGSTS